MSKTTPHLSWMTKENIKTDSSRCLQLKHNLRLGNHPTANQKHCNTSNSRHNSSTLINKAINLRQVLIHYILHPSLKVFRLMTQAIGKCSLYDWGVLQDFLSVVHSRSNTTQRPRAVLRNVWQHQITYLINSLPPVASCIRLSAKSKDF